jgi:hypothetical protein
MERCLACHAPAPLLDQPPSQPPQLRDSDRECGVDCAACHAAGCSYAGRYKSWGPHPVKQDLTRLPCSSFCGACHEKEYVEYRELYLPSLAPSQAVLQCADCHMRIKKSRLTQGHILSLAHPKRAVHDHTFSSVGSDLLHNAVQVGKVAVEEVGGQAVVRFALVNRGAAHSIPTGRFADRSVRISLELLGSDGVVLKRTEHSLLTGPLSSLEPGKECPASITVQLGEARPAAMRISVELLDHDGSFRGALGSWHSSWPPLQAGSPTKATDRPDATED